MRNFKGSLAEQTKLCVRVKYTEASKNTYFNPCRLLCSSVKEVLYEFLMIITTQSVFVWICSKVNTMQTHQKNKISCFKNCRLLTCHPAVFTVGEADTSTSSAFPKYTLISQCHSCVCHYRYRRHITFSCERTAADVRPRSVILCANKHDKKKKKNLQWKHAIHEGQKFPITDLHHIPQPIFTSCLLFSPSFPSETTHGPMSALFRCFHREQQ